MHIRAAEAAAQSVPRERSRFVRSERLDAVDGYAAGGSRALADEVGRKGDRGAGQGRSAPRRSRLGVSEPRVGAVRVEASAEYRLWRAHGDSGSGRALTLGVGVELLLFCREGDWIVLPVAWNFSTPRCSLGDHVGQPQPLNECQLDPGGRSGTSRLTSAAQPGPLGSWLVTSIHVGTARHLRSARDGDCDIPRRLFPVRGRRPTARVVPVASLLISALSDPVRRHARPRTT